jgi:hypothetical protein
MQSYIAWVTPMRDGVPRRYEILADDLEHARELAEDYAVCLFPRDGLAIVVRRA